MWSPSQPRSQSFEWLLYDEGIDPTEVAVMRHRPPENQLRTLLPSFAAERRDLFAAYQSVQKEGAANLLRGCRYLAAFIAQEKGRATYAGLWRIGASQEEDAEQQERDPLLAELFALGAERPPPGETQTRFALEPLDAYEDWIGRLVIDWPSRGINWRLRAHKHVFKLYALWGESQFVEPLPPWHELALSWRQLGLLPASWKQALSQWRGIYFIFDEARERGYVGSAAGQENIMGRWAQYALSGHGGNEGLRNSNPENLRFSILERTSPDLSVEEVVTLEQSWKVRLHTRAHGLNAN